MSIIVNHAENRRGVARFSDLIASPPALSFEFFPPKTPELEQRLWEAITTLAPLNPSFVSVTYGAGGSTRSRTHALVKRIRDETTLEPAAHLTCVGASAAEIDEVAEEYWQAGVRHIVALRGDAPQGAACYEPHPEGYPYADALIAGLLKRRPFEVSVGVYPEGHPDSPSAVASLDYLKRKIDAGATRAITQYFFDVQHYFRFLDLMEKEQINITVTPGILPVGNYEQMLRFSAMCGATVPEWMHRLFAGVEPGSALHGQVAVQIAAQLCQQLYAGGVRQFHFYTLNRAELVLAISRLIGVVPDNARVTRSDGNTA